MTQPWEADGSRLVIDRGTTIGRYVILAPLGGGGMGLVYSAYDPELDRKVALKLVRPRNRPGSESRARLVREAQAMARLAHPNVAAVYDAGVHRDQVFLAMELVEGRSLRLWMNEGPHPRREVLRVFLAAGRGLEAAHRAGLIHRDFKPDNVLLGDDGRARVADFGLARSIGEPAGAAFSDSPGAPDGELTRTGQALGSPAYMAPEQQHGGAVDARADQYSFCVALHEALLGSRPPIAGGRAGTAGTVGAVGTGLPAWLRKVLERGLDLDPERRYPSFGALLSDLSRDAARRRRRWLAGAAAFTALGGLAFLAHREIRSDVRLCRRGAAKIETAWNPSRSATVRQALAASGEAFATAGWPRLESRLAKFAEDWQAMYVDACEATHARGEQSAHLLDMRMACLGRRLRELQATVEVLESADGEVARRSERLLDSLGPLSACADSEALTAEVPPPEDPALRAETERLHGELARAQVLLDASKISAALARLEAALPQVVATGYLPLVAHNQRHLGDVYEELDRLDEAEEYLFEAQWNAIAGGHDKIAAEASASLVWLLGSRRGRYEEARRWGALGRSILEKNPNFPLVKANLLSNLANLESNEGHYEEALSLYEEAIELKRLAKGPHDPRVAQSLSSIGTLYLETGDLENAQLHYERALEILLREENRAHMNRGVVLNDLAVLAFERGDLTASSEYLEQSLAFKEEIFPPGHSQISWTRANLASLYLETGRFHEARTVIEAVLEAAARRGDGPPARIYPRMIRGQVRCELGETAAGLADLDLALDLAVPIHGEMSLDLAELREAHGRCLDLAGRPAEALAAYRRSLATFRSLSRPDDARIADLEISIAALEGRLGPEFRELP